MAVDTKQKRDNFLRHGNRRLKNAVKSIGLLINIANKRYYDYSEKEKNIIFSQLDKAIKEVKNNFNKSKNKERRDESYFK